jgi:hypothetical protein
VREKSDPLNSSPSPDVIARAYAKQSPKFSAAAWRALRIAAECQPALARLFGIHSCDLDSGAFEEQVQETQTFGSVSRFDDNRGFYETRCREQPGIGPLDLLDENALLRLARQGAARAAPRR